MTYLVRAKVVEIKPNGVVVEILGMDRNGFIRRRELSWDRRIGHIPLIPKIGEVIDAVLIEDRPTTLYAYLSLRQLTNPWNQAKDRFQQGQVVQGEVVNVRQFAVFVQIKPGIDARIEPRDIPLEKGQLIVDVLSIGDQVQGIITELDVENRKMNMGVVQRLRQLDALQAARLSVQLEIFQQMHIFEEASNATPMSGPMLNEHGTMRRRYHPPIPKLTRMLVLEDNESDLHNLCDHFRQRMSIDVDGARSSKEALDLVRQGNPYGLAIVDMRLQKEHGAKVAEKLLQEKPDLAIIFISANPLAEEEISILNGQIFPFALKRWNSFDEIDEWVDKVSSGYWDERLVPTTTVFSGPGNFIRQLEMSSFARRPLAEVISAQLAILREETNLSFAVVVEVDPVKQQVSILASSPRLRPDILRFSVDGLYYSPVRQVVEDEEPFYANYVDQHSDGRIRNLFPLLGFKTCYGVPLRIPDFVTGYALFVFDEKRTKMNASLVNRVTLAADFMQVALERSLLLDVMSRYEQRYSNGQLLGSLVHELRVKLEGLKFFALALRSKLLPTRHMSGVGDEAQQDVAEILAVNEELNELVEAYSRVVQRSMEEVDVNSIVSKIKRQLQKRANEANVEIELQMQMHVPMTRAVPSRLEQIVANVVLNAIQQIENQRHRMDTIASQFGQSSPLLQSGFVVIQTRFIPSNTSYPIQIVVIDTGPGIHYHQQNSIFLLDTSTRKEGHGLGLYISRNMAEMMGGRLRLISSIMFVGSAFVIDLPPLQDSSGG